MLSNYQEEKLILKIYWRSYILSSLFSNYSVWVVDSKAATDNMKISDVPVSVDIIHKQAAV